MLHQISVSQADLRCLPEQDCQRCPALTSSRQQIVAGYGDRTSGIVLIGEAPGRHGADRTGVPFSGDRSGMRLQQMLIALGLQFDPTPCDQPALRCFVTNAVRCCPPNNRTPSEREQANCAPFLHHELDLLNPWLIVPIGRVALHAVGIHYLGYDLGPIRPLHATILPAMGRVIVPLLHPSRIAHQQTAAFLRVMRDLLAHTPA